MHILVVGALPSSLVNFRGPLLRAMRARGHKVFAAAGGPDVSTAASLAEWGVDCCPIRIARAGMNPLTDMLTLLDLTRLIRRVRPDAVLSYTVKPVVYGGLAARSAGVKRVFSMIEGLGFGFMEPASIRQWLAGRVAAGLYRLSLRYSQVVFLLNPDDLALFISRRFVRREQAVLVNGTGVDLDHYRVSPVPSAPVFLMVARLLADKGVREYAVAARMLREETAGRKNGTGQTANRSRFLLVGATDANPASIREGELTAWQAEGIIEYWGWMDDVRPAFAECSVYVLPSCYREGLPRTVLEAMSMGRPVITTDAPGCRETVILTALGREQRARSEPVMEGENGFLVRPRDAAAVAAAMAKFLEHPELVEHMGSRSRKLAEEKYDVHKVNATMMEAMGL